jgi:hypothetical protein
MKLDTRRPVLVLLGAWNPAIFRPEWVAAQLLGFPEGEQITVRALLEVKEQKQLLYIGDLGYFVNQQRFEIYSQKYDDAGLRSAANFVAKICEILPHTPLGNFGINFRFLESDPQDRLYEVICTNEHFDQEYRVISQQIITKFARSQDIELNMKRITSEQEILFDFNYHHLTVDKRSLAKITPDYMQLLLDESLDLLRSSYGLTGYDYAAHDFEGIPEGHGEPDDPSA